MIKLSWVDRVRQTEEYHRSRCRDSPKHTIRNTANELRRSYGNVNEDLQLASWIKTYPKLAEIKTIQKALVWMRAKRKEIRIR